MDEQQQQPQSYEEGLALGFRFHSSNSTLFSSSSSPDPNHDPFNVKYDQLKPIPVEEIRNLSLNEHSVNQDDQYFDAVEKYDKTTTDHWKDDGENKRKDGHQSVVIVSQKKEAVDVRVWGLDEDAKFENNGDNEIRSTKSQEEFDDEYGNAYGNFKEEEGLDEKTDRRSDDEIEDVKKGYDGNGNGNDIDGGASESGRYNRSIRYPFRPGAEDCSYYVKTGMCRFGMKCKFSHPRRKNQGAKDKVKQKKENLEKLGQTECKYYLTSGGCKFGKDCRYSHSMGKTVVAPILEFNFLDLPIRPGEKECPYYMRTGSCKYVSSCRFNHPEPTGGNDPHSGYGNGGSIYDPQLTMPSWSSSRTLNDTAPYVLMMFPPTQGSSFPNPEWNGYQASSYPASKKSLPTPPAFAMSNPAAEIAFYPLHQQIPAEEFPERPGQPECTHFLRTGDCKFKSNCKFHHPKTWIANAVTCILSDKGLPLRPDQNICSHYNRYGICKFGPSCKFDHPASFGNSAFSPRS